MKFRSRARQWSRAAWALAALFASLPLAGRILMGSWGFQGSGELAGLCLVAGTYLHFAARRHRVLPDDAATLERALQLAAAGETSEALRLLTETIRLTPSLWQAYQFRGQVYLQSRDCWDRAMEDFNQAIRRAPKEAHLYVLRAQLHSLLGDEASADRDYQSAARLRAAEQLSGSQSH